MHVRALCTRNPSAGWFRFQLFSVSAGGVIVYRVSNRTKPPLEARVLCPVREYVVRCHGSQASTLNKLTESVGYFEKRLTTVEQQNVGAA